MAKPAIGDIPQNASVVARWLLDENSGNALDDVGSNDLTDNGTVGSVADTPVGGFAKARDFERSNSEYFSRNDNADLSPTGDLTIAVWLNVEAESGTLEIVNKDDDGSNRDYRWRYNTAATNNFQYCCNSGGGLTCKSVNNDIGTGTWVHVVMVYDASAGEVKFFVDGSQVGSTQTGLPTSIRNGTGAFGLGVANLGATPTNFWDGYMQDMLFFKGAELSDAEVTELYDLYADSAAVAAADKSYAYLMSLAGTALSLKPLTELFMRRKSGLFFPGPQFQFLKGLANQKAFIQ